MADEPSNGELARRLDDIHRLLQGLVSRVEYSAYQQHLDHRFTELERDVADVRRDLVDRRREHAADIKDLSARMDDRDKTGGSNFRQGVYQGLLPAVLILVGILVQVGLALRGGK